jgi:hypothetical protein
MKKFAKVFLSCAAVAALTGAVATSAMAADLTNVAYNSATGTVTFTAADAGTTQTLLVISGTDKTNFQTEAIKQIDQQDAAITSAVVGTLADGTYTVLVGGNGATEVYSGTFTVGDAAKILIGDADQDGYVDGGDATQILKYNVGKVTLEGDALAAADADQDSYVDGGDATAILKYNVGKTDSTNEKVNTLK